MNLLVSSFAGVLSSIAAVVRSYDLAFIILAAATYCLLAPFSYRGQWTVYQIQRARPAIEKLRKQFEGDRRKLNESILALYRERRIAIVGVVLGWIPLLVQALLLVAPYLIIPSLPCHDRSLATVARQSVGGRSSVRSFAPGGRRIRIPVVRDAKAQSPA